jgi:predicted ATPase/DNA-binding CsgD family transcriptional regulator
MASPPKKRLARRRASRRRPKRIPVTPVEPPPPALGHAVSHNLPVQVTSFIGREREIAEVKRLLSVTHLLTLTGAGGCGKSRLALQVASELLQDYVDGVWLAQLASLSDPGFVPQTIASALRVPEQSGRAVTETLARALRFKSLLLVVDNCEHMLSACAELADALVPVCSSLRILATSQEPLGVPGEAVWRVPSLSVPGVGRLPPVDHLMQYGAVRLFVERATSAQPGLTLTDSNAAAVVQVCHRLDGIPLAIELAAARVKVLTVEQIASRLDDRFRLLTGGSRRILPRHRTLRAAMDWSYGLLSEKERTALQRLSTFAGGWTLEAAEAVCSGNGIEAADVLDLLTQLADKSLVVVETQVEEARYLLPETVRQYSLDRLMESEEAADAQRRHRDWYLGLAERAEPELRGPGQVTWLERLEKEHDNLRAALEWSRMEEGGAEAGLRLTGALYWFWFMHGHWSDGRQWLEVALARRGDAQSSARPKVLRGAAHLAWRQGDYERATTLCEQGLAICRDLGDREGSAWLNFWLAAVATQRGDYARATALLDESLGLCDALGNKWLGSAALAWLGIVARYQNDYVRAAAFAEKSLALAKHVGDRYRIAFDLRRLGTLALHQGECERAAGFYKESLTLCREVGIRWIVEECLEGLAGVASARRHYEQAARLFAAAEALRIALDHHRPPPDQADYEQRVASTRAALEQTAFAAAWAHGAEMAPEQAIEYALMSVEPAPPKGTARFAGDRRSDPLTPREREVAGLIAQGFTNREIAAHLVITERTAESHVQHVLDKLGFASRGRIAAWATEQGLHKSSRS